MLAHGSGCVFYKKASLSNWNTPYSETRQCTKLQQYSRLFGFVAGPGCGGFSVVRGSSDYKHDVIAEIAKDWKYSSRGIKTCSDSCSSDVSGKPSPQDWLIQPPCLMSLMPKVVVSRANINGVKEKG